jgi:hypothetical protein
MSWAETMLAVNSTVGTENFKPLDVIIKDNFRLVGTTDTLFYTYTGGYTKDVANRRHYSNMNVSIDCDGTAYIEVPFRFYPSFATQDFYVRVYSADNVLKNEVSYTYNRSMTEQAVFREAKINVPITVVKNEAIRVEVCTRNDTETSEFEGFQITPAKFRVLATLVGGDKQFHASVEEG